MRMGTNSILFGAHQFLIHPWFVAWSWWQLYGTRKLGIAMTTELCYNDCAEANGKRGVLLLNAIGQHNLLLWAERPPLGGFTSRHSLQQRWQPSGGRFFIPRVPLGEASMALAYIYALIDPRDNEVRYIGYSHDPKKRLGVHLAEKAHTKKNQWIRGLKKAGLKPILKIIDEASSAEIANLEIEWIARYKSQGAKLLNGTSGGDSFGDYAITPEHRAKIVAANTGKKRSPEAVARISAGSRGRKYSEEIKQRMSEIRKGRIFSDEHKDAVRQGVIESWQDPEKRENRLRSLDKRREATRKAWETRRAKKQNANPDGDS